MNIKSLQTRLEKLTGNQFEDIDCENFYLVRSNSVLPPEKMPPFTQVAPGIDVDIRPMKQSEFRAIMASIDGKSRSVEVLEPDYSKLPKHMKPNDKEVHSL